jgi:hypothetical protein
VLISRIEPIDVASDHLIDVDGLRKFPLAASATSKLGVETLNKR